MVEIVFLAHRIPYPPNKGDKIRAWHFLRGLAQSHTVHLGCFIDAPEDWTHVTKLQEICGECHFSPLARTPMQPRNLLALLRGEPITVRHYDRPEFRRWVDDICARRQISAIYAYSGATAQYAASLLRRDVHCVIDFVDLDSSKWRQYAERAHGPMRWIYAREANRLLDYEKRVAGTFDAAVFVSRGEADDFVRSAPQLSIPVRIIPNGVDTDYFVPQVHYPSPFPAERRAIVFTGAMNYLPNQDAVTWFAHEAFAQLRAARPELEFWIVGASPSAPVRRLARLPGVSVTGTVPDVRPYLAHAAAIVVPMRMGRGIQNKVLEAMSMSRPVVMSRLASIGLDHLADGHNCRIVDTAASLAEAIGSLLVNTAKAAEIGRQARLCVLTHYRWENSLSQIDELLSKGTETRATLMRSHQ